MLGLVLVSACTTATADAPPVAQPGTGATASASPTPTTTPETLPEAAKVLARLAKVSRAGIGTSGISVLSDTGATIAQRKADLPLAPASNMKVLSALAALDALGADHTFTTTVVSPGEGRLVLVGGGDPLLTDKPSKSAAKPASLKELATSTAAALTAAGVKKVRLGYDDTLFAGPDFNPVWKASWRTYVARVSPLVIGEGVFNAWSADPTPARTATAAFAKRLTAAGITVTLTGRAEAPADADVVAVVHSAPLSTVIARTLKLSDNLAAEVLARHYAIAAGATPSFTGAASAVKAWLKNHQLWAKGMKLLDGSGLSNRSRVTPNVLAHALVLSLTTPTLNAVAAGLPVAGKSGTLKDRFNDPAERAGRGNVHAKTGTLIGISALTGYLTTADGDRLVFAAVGNGVSGQTTGYNWLDRSASALARCGCG
ncbi:MAG: D-alanyl-D-alanine carboxypeptidase/D-alanyl-D-alanine-endopeptidase [Actinobacteria bacterium]|nr:D-alanyl-D-alanine carboxypeptidase/D-alanyl-D-alanine-endopeptidase [Actinomycetota bacterium]